MGRELFVTAVVVVIVAAFSANAAFGKINLRDDGKVVVDGRTFGDMREYHQSDYFKSSGRRCGTKAAEGVRDPELAKSTADCYFTLTSIQNEYWPVDIAYQIPVWWHVIRDSTGTQGNVTDEQINAQMKVLNEDFRAAEGSLGQNGIDVKIQFTLAGITRTARNDLWFNDTSNGYMYNLNVDPSKYLNIYTNNTSYLGYATIPQDPTGPAPGTALDGIVLQYLTVGGRYNGNGVYNQGRTLVHEMGHYLGLFHTFHNGYTCGNSYISGDLIVDTNPENVDHYGCTQTFTCGSADPIENYMNYTDDICMEKFTREQANRAVCSLVNYRPTVFTIIDESEPPVEPVEGIAVPPFLTPLILSE